MVVSMGDDRDPDGAIDVKQEVDTHVAAAGWMTPGVAGIGTASLLSDAGHEIPTALLPSLPTSTLGAAAALGVIEGASDALAGVARFGGGALADDAERRRVVAVDTTTAELSAGIGGGDESTIAFNVNRPGMNRRCMRRLPASAARRRS
jgi:hypothetical protein